MLNHCPGPGCKELENWAAREWDFTKLPRFLADQRGLIWDDEQILAEREGKGAVE